MNLNDYQTYYVYLHQHPKTDEVVYVGMGQRDRAWNVRVRQTEHSQWMEDLLKEGYTPADWVKISAKQLTKDLADTVETELIKQHNPMFNRAKNVVYLLNRRDQALVGIFKALREMGYSYTKIAFLSGAEGLKSRDNKNAATIWRYVNDRSY